MLLQKENVKYMGSVLDTNLDTNLDTVSLIRFINFHKEHFQPKQYLCHLVMQNVIYFINLFINIHI